MRAPIGYEIITKAETYRDPKDGTERRRSAATKNELMRNMISAQIQNRVKCKYILADSRFGSSENMRFINKKKKTFIFEMKENRLAAVNETDRNKGLFERIDSLKIPERKPAAVWLKDLEIPAVIYKQVFKNKDGTEGERFLVTNDVTLKEAK